MKTKHKFPIDHISKLEITSERDKFLLVRVSQELNKEKVCDFLLLLLFV